MSMERAKCSMAKFEGEGFYLTKKKIATRNVIRDVTYEHEKRTYDKKSMSISEN